MVVVNGASSSPLAVTSGVPQGSFPGPSLCLVYVNDIGSSPRHSSIRLFADDALLYSPIQNTGDMVSFQRDLSSLEQWANEWCLTFNVKKCQMVLFRGGLSLRKQQWLIPFTEFLWLW